MKIIKYSINPYWVTGFTDAEGCFFVGLDRIKDSTKLSVRPAFMIKLHIRDLYVLKQIKSFFKEKGNIHIYETFAIYRVQSRKDLMDTVIPHFIKYPLLTQKQNDFHIFNLIVNILVKEPLNQNNILKIIGWKASLNKGLSDSIKILFPNVIPMKRPLISPQININPYWFAGFFSGEGCFLIDIFKDKEIKIGYRVVLKVIVGQHSRDKNLVRNFVNLFNSGWIKETSNYVELYISNFQIISNEVIPFFEKYLIIGEKSHDFLDFCQVANLIKNKLHLTENGLEEIKKVKSRMNKSRYINK